ncbi:MAG: FmdB family zinc ribbon protein [Planctomycetota bacterium]|jgi:hypothetical protein
MQNSFRCNACGHQFAGNAQALAQNPSCPRCQTFGQIIGADGQFVNQAKTVARIQRPAAGSNPYRQAGHAAPGLQEDYDDYVEVDGGALLGTKKSNKNLVTMVVLAVTGISIIGFLWIIVGMLKEDRTENLRQEKEVVQDPKAFEKSVNKSIDNVRKILGTIDKVEITETTDFKEVVDIINDTPNCDALVLPGAQIPGSPFKYKGFVVKSPYKNTPDFNHGFVMLLYYKTAAEVQAAEKQIKTTFGGSTINYSFVVDSETWYVAYSGCRYNDGMASRIKRALENGAPSDFKQFTDRVGSTGNVD